MVYSYLFRLLRTLVLLHTRMHTRTHTNKDVEVAVDRRRAVVVADILRRQGVVVVHTACEEAVHRSHRPPVASRTDRVEDSTLAAAVARAAEHGRMGVEVVDCEDTAAAAADGEEVRAAAPLPRDLS